MTRIRLALLLVAIGVGVPIALLAWRALDGLALERAIRHQAVAERAFDEMERALSTWLVAEEARPFEQYRFYAAPGSRSPLAGPPSEDFVVGAFQVDPDGSVHTPMRPRDLRAAEARGDWPPPPATLEAIERVTQLVADTWTQDAAGDADLSRRRSEDEKPQPKSARQDPGTTLPLGGPLASKKELAKSDFADEAEGEGASVYDVLQGLNRGAEARAERKQKVVAATTELAAAAPEPAREEAEVVSELEQRAPAAPPSERDGVMERQKRMLEPERPNRLGALGYVVSDESVVGGRVTSVAPADDVAEAFARLRKDVATVRVALDPMVGRAAGDTYLLLYRTVLVGEQGYRQGLVVDRAKLGDWLARRALGTDGLDRVASVRFDAPDAAGGAGAGDGFVFQHRFAEPFDDLSARLTLASLSGVGSPGAIYALVGLLIVVGAAGLFAIHRMVGVVVHFAERRSNFVSAVTHELKTPLTAIRMYAEMLRDGLVPTDAKKGEYYATITDESERLSRLIDNVLEFSRLERGTREMSFSVGPPGPVVLEAAEKLRAHAEREGFRLELEVDDELPPVRYDRDALLQVLFNLVDNAMKYAGQASPRRVVLEAHAKGGGVELSVRDFGPGVPGRHLSRIFEPFYRGEDERVRSTKGTGIGLALVRDLAERMGAAVRGANADGGGFRVCLAFRAAEG